MFNLSFRKRLERSLKIEIKEIIVRKQAENLFVLKR